jgi:hypothetical protein
MNKRILFLLAFFAFGLSAVPYEEILNAIRKLGRDGIEQVQSVETVGTDKYVIAKFKETCNKNILFISKDNGKNFFEKIINTAQACINFDQIAMCNSVLYVTQRAFSPYEIRVFASFNLGNDFIEIKNTDIDWRDCAAERDLIQ